MNTHRLQRQRSDHDRTWNQGPPRRHPQDPRGMGDTPGYNEHRRPWPTAPENYGDTPLRRRQYDDERQHSNSDNEDMSNYGVGGYYGNTYRQESYEHERSRPRVQFDADNDRHREFDDNGHRWPRAYEQRALDEVNHRGKGPRGYQRSDKRIREDISDRLCDDRFVDATEIEVLVENAEVTLKGTVDSREAKRIAEDISERVSGVKNVENRLRIQSNHGQDERRQRQGYAQRHNH